MQTDQRMKMSFCQRSSAFWQGQLYTYHSDSQDILCYMVWIYDAIDAANNRRNNCNNRRGDRLQR